jgi:GTP-dependent phosphoenolpyruvate carboxykinase
VVSTANPARGAFGVTDGANPNGNGAAVATLGGTTVFLDCGIVITNDKEVTLKIDSITFKVRPG